LAIQRHFGAAVDRPHGESDIFHTASHARRPHDEGYAMLIIWRGWGILAIPVFLCAIMVCTKLCDAIAGPDYWNAHTWPTLLSVAVAGGALIGLGKILGEGHELFFIPVKMLGGLCIAGFMVGCVVAMVASTEPSPTTVKTKPAAMARASASVR
jgi:hypothetical protein